MLAIHHLLLTLTISLSATLTLSVTALGEPCSIQNNRLDSSSHKFLSDCGPTEYCALVTSSFSSSSSNHTLAPSVNLINIATTAGTVAEFADKQEYNDQYTDDDSGNGDDDNHDTGRKVKRASGQSLLLAAAQQPLVIPNSTQPAQTAQVSATCQPKGCRRDEYPFGYGQNDILPPRCSIEEFCPDESDACQPLIPLGGACQLNRDDQCLPPPNAALLSNENNFNGSICLAYTCQYANVGIGEECKIDNTVYSGFLPDGSQFTDIVSRDNCATNLYCSSDSLRCELRLLVGSPCTSDSQCQSGNCDTNDLCVAPPETPSPVPRSVLVLVPLGIITVMSMMVMGLWTCHQRARKRRGKVLQEYWLEQMAYRKSIMSLHSTATRTRRSTIAIAQRRRRRRVSVSEASPVTYTDGEEKNGRRRAGSLRVY